MKSRLSPPFKRNFGNDLELTLWARSLCNCRLAVTITFGTGRGAAITSPSIRTTEEIVRKGIKRLNTLCYKNLAKRKGLSIGAITAIEGKGPFNRIHAHIAFEPPPDMSSKQFTSLTDRAFKRSKWIEQRPFIKECVSQNWINYLLKTGQDGLVPSCCFRAKH